MKLIVGLGNPGDKYTKVRHNLGFMVLDSLTKKLSGQWSMEEKFKAETLKLGDLILAKPQTFMNQSGSSVASLVKYFKINPEDVTVIHDELDLPLGKIKVRLGGAAAGHHGVESIIAALDSDQFIRVRLGIGNLRTQSAERKGQTIGVEKYVLEPFMPNERSKVKHMLKQALEAVELLVDKGLAVAQNQNN